MEAENTPLFNFIFLGDPKEEPRCQSVTVEELHRILSEVIGE